MPKNLKLLTYNMRKGKGASGRAQLSTAIGAELSLHNCDLVLAQEVFHPCPRRHAHKEPCDGQSGLLSAATGLKSYYEPNKHRRVGHHGNATLSRLPVAQVRNHDLSTNTIERRGVLYTRFELSSGPLHVFNTHLGLTHGQRRRQAQQIGQLIAEYAPGDEPVLLAGDFNDWTRSLDRVLTGPCGLHNAFGGTRCKTLRTWPAARPVFNLDRVYVRHLEVTRAERLHGEPWNVLSDHLPLKVEFSLR